MLDSATCLFIDDESLRGGRGVKKSNKANMNINRDDVAERFIDGEPGIVGGISAHVD